MRHFTYIQQINSGVAYATLMLILVTFTMAGAAKQIEQQQNVSEITIIFTETTEEETNLNVGTQTVTENPTTFMAEELTPIASELVKTTLEILSNNNSSDEQTSLPTSTLTTLRPYIKPTIPEFRRRATNTRTYSSKHHHEHHWGPFFEDPLNATSETQQIGFHHGTEAILNCRVGMLRDKTVMWVRRTTDKVSLLTVGNNTYTGDTRININYQYPNNWRLHISPIEKEDAGMYMCQVSTHPPRVFATNVTVLGPAVRVVDEHGHEVHDRYYKTGSEIDLTCQVAITYLSALPTVRPGAPNHFNPTSTATTVSLNIKENLKENELENSFDFYHKKLIWRKDDEALPKNTSFTLSTTQEWRSSRLSIPHADRSNSGVYSCSILNSTTAAVVHVQVLNGETPAAVQHNGGHLKRPIYFILFLFYLPMLHIS